LFAGESHDRIAQFLLWLGERKLHGTRGFLAG
jgi:hypothetical protein